MTAKTSPIRDSFIKRNLGKIVVSILIGATFIFLFGSFRSMSSCNVCGQKRSRIELFIPYTELKILQWTTDFDTPVSIGLRNNKIVLDHQHNWEFASGSGNGTMCAIGPARHFVGTLDSVEIAAVIDTMSVHHELNFRDQFIQRVFDPERSQYLSIAFSDQNKAVYTPNSNPTNEEIQAFIKESIEQWNWRDEVLNSAGK